MPVAGVVRGAVGEVAVAGGLDFVLAGGADFVDAGGLDFVVVEPPDFFNGGSVSCAFAAETKTPTPNRTRHGHFMIDPFCVVDENETWHVSENEFCGKNRQFSLRKRCRFLAGFELCRTDGSRIHQAWLGRTSEC